MSKNVGTAHIGIQVGELIVHWFSTSFAIPKEWKGGGATAVFYPQDRNGQVTSPISLFIQILQKTQVFHSLFI